MRIGFGTELSSDGILRWLAGPRVLWVRPGTVGGRPKRGVATHWGCRAPLKAVAMVVGTVRNIDLRLLIESGMSGAWRGMKLCYGRRALG